MKKKSGIYMILNKNNGKLYIGSAIDLDLRKKTHFRNLKNNMHRNQYLQNAYNKYGKSIFNFIILEIIKNTESLINREQFYLIKFNSFDRKNGYNICSEAGNMYRYRHTDETIEKMSEIKKGRKLKPFTEEHKRKLREAQPHQKEIYQYGLDGNFIQNYQNITVASKKLCLERSLISSVCRGKRKSCGKFMFKYALDYVYGKDISEWKRKKYKNKVSI